MSPMSPALAGGFFTISAAWEAHEVNNLEKKKWIQAEKNMDITGLGVFRTQGKLENRNRIWN